MTLRKWLGIGLLALLIVALGIAAKTVGLVAFITSFVTGVIVFFIFLSAIFLLS